MFVCVAYTDESIQSFGPSFDTKDQAWQWFRSDSGWGEKWTPRYSEVDVLAQADYEKQACTWYGI